MSATPTNAPEAPTETRAQRIERAILTLDIRSNTTSKRPEDLFYLPPGGGLASCGGKSGGKFMAAVRAALGEPIPNANIRACLEAMDLSQVPPLPEDEFERRLRERIAAERAQRPPHPRAATVVEDDEAPTEDAPQVSTIRAIGSPKSKLRPEIKYTPARYKSNVIAAVASLRIAGGIYVSGGKLVHLGTTTAQEESASRWVDSDGRERHGKIAGSVYIATLAREVLKMQLSESASFQKHVDRRGGWVPCSPPDDVVGAVHELKTWELPRLVSV